MELSWIQSFAYSFLFGLTDIFPVSSQAHRALSIKFLGVSDNTALLDLLIHTAITAALLISCYPQILKISRAKALARVPKNKRRRPLDTKTLMEYRMLQTMLVPCLLGLFCYRYGAALRGNMLVTAILLLANGLILYIPQFLPGSNRDARHLSPVEGLLMGLGGAASMFPGISAVGVSTSIGYVCAVERNYALNMALLMKLPLTVALLIFDVLALGQGSVTSISLGILLRYVLSAVIAFVAALLAIRGLRAIAAKHNFSIFGLYCTGLSLFIFILNLIA